MPCHSSAKVEDVTLASQDTTYVPRPWSPEQHYRTASLCALLCLRELMCRPSSETDMFIKSAFLWLPHYPQPSYFWGSFYKQVTYMRLEKLMACFHCTFGVICLMGLLPFALPRTAVAHMSSLFLVLFLLAAWFSYYKTTADMA